MPRALSLVARRKVFLIKRLQECRQGKLGMSREARYRLQMTFLRPVSRRFKESKADSREEGQEESRTIRRTAGQSIAAGRHPRRYRRSGNVRLVTVVMIRSDSLYDGRSIRAVASVSGSVQCTVWIARICDEPSDPYKLNG